VEEQNWENRLTQVYWKTAVNTEVVVEVRIDSFLMAETQ